MKPKELTKYLQNQDPKTGLPMSPEMATGQMPGVPALPGFDMPEHVKADNDDDESEELFAEGGAVPEPKPEEESPIIIKLREMLMGKPDSSIMSDQNQVQKADKVDNSYSKGGMVQQVKDHISQLYDKAKKGPLLPDSTLAGFQNLVSSPTAQSPAPTTPGYAGGGFISDPLLSQPQSFQEALTPPAGPQFNPQAGLPIAPNPPPQASIMPAQTLAPTPAASPAAIAPNSASNPYFSQQKAQLGKYGPEELLALQNSLQEQRQGLGSKVPVALGGLADAIMQGVARAGSGGFADRIQNQQNEMAKEKLGAFESAGKMNKENVEGNAQIDAMDPKSQLSKVAQASYGPLLIKNGFKPGQVQGMSAKNISDLTGKTVEALKAESEAKMAAASLGLKAQAQKSEEQHQRSEEERSKADEIMKAGDRLQKSPIQRLFNKIPGQAGLENIVGGSKEEAAPAFSPDVMNYAQKHGISPQEALAYKNARGGR